MSPRPHHLGDSLALCAHNDCDNWAVRWATDDECCFPLCSDHAHIAEDLGPCYDSDGRAARIDGVSVELTPDLADALGTYRYTTPAEQVGESLDYLRRHLPEELGHTPADIDAAWAEDVGGDAEEVVPFVGAWSYCGVRCG